jgi:hypothetical protein
VVSPRRLSRKVVGFSVGEAAQQLVAPDRLIEVFREVGFVFAATWFAGGITAKPGGG